MATTDIFGFPYADTTYPDGFITALAAAIGGVEDNIVAAVVPRFADATARDTLLTAPVVGQKCRLTSDGVVYRYNGTTWKAWESEYATYTATLTNIAVGTGGSAAQLTEYRYEAGLVRVHFKLILGTSGASVSGIPQFTLPVTATALDGATIGYPGLTTLLDVSVPTTYYEDVGSVSASTTAVRILLRGTNGVIGAISSTVPFTWAAGDILAGEFTYRPA